MNNEIGEFQQEIYNAFRIPSELLNQDKPSSFASAQIQLDLFRKKIGLDICQGYSSNTPDGIEYDCDYEFAGEVDCGSCIFNLNLPLEYRTQDPRVNPNIEEE